MENKAEKKTDTQAPEKGYELLSRADKGQEMTVRDDQYEFSWLLDSVKLYRRRGSRFRLIDSGKLSRSQLEWLGEAGADLYSSDEARTDSLELELVNKFCKKGGGIFAYFFHGPLENEGKEESGSVPFSSLLEMGRSGIYLHSTNRERKRDLSRLNEVAHACRRGRSWLVYYHHGPIESSLEELGMNGVWIHISDQSLSELDESTLVLDAVRSVLSAGAKLVLHLEEGLDFSLLRNIMRAGAFVLFKSSLINRDSPFQNLVKKARQRKLDFRAYYLYPNFLP